MTSGTVEGHKHGRVPRAVREQQVLELAEALFLERGFAGASMDELARRAGVSKPVVYDLVGSKERLFELLVGRFADALEAAVAGAVVAAAGEGIAAQVRAGGLAYLRHVGDRPDAFAVLLAGGATAFAAGVEGIRRRQARLVADLLAAQAGGQADPLELEAVAVAMNGAWEAATSWWAEHPELGAEQVAAFVSGLVVPGVEALATRWATRSA